MSGVLPVFGELHPEVEGATAVVDDTPVFAEGFHIAHGGGDPEIDAAALAVVAALAEPCGTADAGTGVAVPNRWADAAKAPRRQLTPGLGAWRSLGR